MESSLTVASTVAEDVNSNIADEDVEVEGILKSAGNDIGATGRASSATSTPTLVDPDFRKRQAVKGKCYLFCIYSYTLSRVHNKIMNSCINLLLSRLEHENNSIQACGLTWSSLYMTT